jgi:hypothetical protein
MKYLDPPHYQLGSFEDIVSAENWLNECFAQGYRLVSIAERTVMDEFLVVIEFQSREQWDTYSRKLDKEASAK